MGDLIGAAYDFFAELVRIKCEGTLLPLLFKRGLYG